MEKIWVRLDKWCSVGLLWGLPLLLFISLFVDTILLPFLAIPAILVFVGWQAFKFHTVAKIWDFEKQQNAQDTSVKLFKEQIDRTKNTLQIFDDGNYMKEGIYDDKNVMKALENKIKQNENFKISIQFNSKPNENSIFELAKKFKENIEIKHNPDGNAIKREGEEIHFRISDDGEFCHISKHKVKDMKRSYISYERPNRLFCLPFIDKNSSKNHPIFFSQDIFNSQKDAWNKIEESNKK